MAGIIQLQNKDRSQALGKLQYLSQLEKNRNTNNDNIASQRNAQRKQSLASGVGGVVAGALTGNPVSMVMGGLSILGGLF